MTNSPIMVPLTFIVLSFFYPVSAFPFLFLLFFWLLFRAQRHSGSIRRQWSFITYIFFPVWLSAVWLNVCDTVRLSCLGRLLPALHMAGLMGWSLWPIHFVCNAGKLDSLFPDDSYIDMGEIDVGRKVAQQIPPGIFWRSQVFIDHPMYLKFNVSLSKDALVGIYGRRGLPPSHTQVSNIWTPLHFFLPLSRCFVMNVRLNCLL